jgi:hypothetical protein
MLIEAAAQTGDDFFTFRIERTGMPPEPEQEQRETEIAACTARRALGARSRAVPSVHALNARPPWRITL